MALWVFAVTRPILTSIGAFAIVLLLALAACSFMPGDNGGGVPYYPDRPVQKPTAMNIIPSVPIRGDHDALWSVFYTGQSPNTAPVNIVGFAATCPTRSVEILSMDTHDFSGRVCVAQENAR